MLPILNVYLPVNFEPIFSTANTFVQLALHPYFLSTYVTQALFTVTTSSWVLMSDIDSSAVQYV